jgi:phage portal protein BeeE
MNFLSKLFKSRDKPKNSLLGGGHWFFFGGSSSGKAVNERSAMQMTAVYACVRVLSESIAGLPLHLFRYNREGKREECGISSIPLPGFFMMPLTRR